jgi:glycosyltransferase involved in cell wall biosynthesis
MADFCIALVRHRREYLEKFGNPDVIVASSPHPYSVLVAWIMAKGWKCKLVFEVRDLWPLSLIQIAGVSKWHPLVWITGWVERFAYRRADAIVSLLPGAKGYMVSRGLAPERFFCVPNGALLSTQASERKEDGVSIPSVIAFAKHLLGRGCFLVIYPGSMGPPNNMKPLVRAASLISEAGVDSIQFILMGQGSEIAELRQMTTNICKQNVHFFPQADRSVALELMSIASAGYVSVKRLPIYRHGISFNKLFEYMQHGLPVIFAADVPENPVLLSGCGVVTSPDQPEKIAEAIVALAQLPLPIRADMGRAGTEYVKKFHDYPVLSAQYLDAIECLVR